MTKANGKLSNSEAQSYVRDVHYRIARLIAEGRRTSEIAAVTGMSISLVSCLRHDPKFQPLVDQARERIERVEDELYAKRRAKEDLVINNALDRMNDSYFDPSRLVPHEQARLDYATITERVDGNQPSVVLHGNVSEIPLAELVTLRRKRADQLLLEASSSTTSLSDGATSLSDGNGSGPDSNSSLPQPEPVPASTKPEQQ